ncbi:terpene synthase family protein [Halorarum salinum]|uniref:Uncharacterized protein n=1 Tax=Halorarum salinum TaxID=2743089 RepID=A0A7D5LCV9_9EURY|nr:hypothetical protein [Halobaculum salinum]QLG63614.1 hypothetical protein HUG12_18525 [Halobaculum salinum]
MDPDSESTDASDVRALRERSLPADVERLVERYLETVPERGRYVWGWLDDALPTFRLSSVPPSLTEPADEARLLLLVYVTALNDLADRREDDAAFEAAAAVPRRDREPSAGSDPAVRVAADAWTALLDHLEGAPRADARLDTLVRDVRWACAGLRHGAHAAANPAAVTYEECLHAQAPTMCMDPLATVDLTYSPTFDPTEEPAVREAVALAESVARVGNWLTTWERELAEGDLANGVVVKAVEDGVVTPEAARAARTDPSTRPSFRDRIVDRGVERAVARDWRRRFRRVTGASWSVDTVDLEGYVSAMAGIRRRQDAGRGRK